MTAIQIVLDIKTERVEDWLTNLSVAQQAILEAIDKMETNIGTTQHWDDWAGWGFSGFQSFRGGYIKIDTYPSDNYAALNIYAEEPYDPKAALHYLLWALPHSVMGYTIIPRNNNFNQEPRNE